MLEFLNRPYPFSFQPSRRIKQLLPIGLSVFAFLIIFKPFGLNNDPDYIQSSAFFACSGTIIGLITTVIIPYLIPGFFNESKWILKRNLFWSVCIYFCFATLMFLAFNIYGILHYKVYRFFTFHTYLWWVYLNLIFGVPLGIIVNLVNQFYLLKKHLKIADNINSTIEIKNQQAGVDLLEFEVDKYKKVLIEVNNLVYVEALGNYVNIAYNNDGLKKIAIRETITNIEQRIGNSDVIYKPHRSYLINVGYVEKVTGDSQGLKIHFKGFDKVVPVSRNKIKEFRTHITANS